MSRIIRRTFSAVLAAALLACSQDGQAASAAEPQGAPQAARAGTGAGLYREAAAQPPAQGVEATVPQASLAPLIERLKPAVVNISTTTAVKHPPIARGPRSGPGGQGKQEYDEFFERFFGRPAPEMPEEFRGASLGSGFVLNTDGFILTNNHVVKDATDILVRLSDGREFRAAVVGKDPPTDVALIKLTHPPQNLPTVVLGDSDALRQGDYVLALGSPFGLRDTATLGIVSAKNRSNVNPGGGGTFDDFIQTDAAINPGNSGGPLFNLRGEVVGINTAIVSPQIGQGIGFAVPVNLAKAILPQLREKGKVTRGFMGVSVQDLNPDLRQAFGLGADVKGALVQNTVARGPAAKAGLEAGDVVVAINGKPVESSGTLTRTVSLVPPGETVNVTVLRKGERKEFAFKVGTRPDDEARVARGEFDEGEEAPAAPAQEGNKAPKLGVNLGPIGAEEARELGVDPGSGALVREVVDGGPAERAGIRPGDVIVEVNRQPVKAPGDVASRIGKMKDGEMALLRVRRGQTAVYIAVPVGGRL